MEKNAFGKWENFISNTLRPGNLDTTSLDKGVIDSLFDESKTIREEFRTYLFSEAFLSKGRPQCKMLIQHCQSFLAYFSNVVFEYQTDPELSFSARKIYEQAGTDLDTMILFLQNSFPQ